MDDLTRNNDEYNSFSDTIVDQSDNMISKVFLSGATAALICAGIWIIISYTLKIQMGYMALGIGLGVGYTIRWVSKSNSEKFAFISAGLSFSGWLLGTIITYPMYSLSTIDIIFCMLAVGEGFYFVAYSKNGPEIEKEEDELDALLREKEKNKEELKEDKSDDEYENRRHNDPHRAKRIYENMKRNNHGPLL